MNILYFLSLITLTEALQNNWVDPHEMKINGKNKFHRSLSENDKIPDAPKESVINIAKPAEENMSLIYLKRTINLILQSANKEEDDLNVYTGIYKYTLDSEEYQFLVEFTSNIDKKTSDEELRRLDAVLSTIFSKSYHNNILNFVTDIKEQIFNIYFLIFVGVTICLYVVYRLLKNNSGFLNIILYFGLLLLIVDYGVRYRSLYEEAEEHNMKVTYTTACDTSKMSWSQYFKFIINSKDCEKRKVTPLDVGLNQLKHVIIIPLESVGTGMGKFGKEVWNNLPFPWNIVIFPILLVFILVIIFIHRITSKNIGFKLKLFPFFWFELIGKEKHCEDRISGETLNKLLDATNHKRIEDTRSSPVKTQPKRTRYKNKSPNNEKLQKNEKKQPVQDAFENIDKMCDKSTKNTSTDCTDDKKEK